MDGVRYCPNCGQANPHLLRRDEHGLFAWCQGCFRVYPVEEKKTETEDEPPPEPERPREP